MSFIQKLTDFLSIKTIVLLGVAFMGLMIIVFSSTMIYLSSTIKYDQDTLKEILSIEKQNKDIIHTIKELNYLDTQILLAKDINTIESIKETLLKYIEPKNKLALNENQIHVKKYNFNLKKVTKLVNKQIDLQKEIYETSSIILFHKKELSNYIKLINGNIKTIGMQSSKISGIASLNKKRAARKIKKTFKNTKKIDKREVDKLKKLFSPEMEKITSLTHKLDKNVLNLLNIINNISLATNVDTINSITSNKLFQLNSLLENILDSLNDFKSIDKENLNIININLLKIKDLESFFINSKKQILSKTQKLDKLRTQREKINQELFKAFDQLNVIADEIKIDILNHSDNIAKKTSIVTLVVGIIFFILVFISAFTLIARINVPLAFMTKFIKRLVNHEESLSKKIPINYHDEFGELSESFNNMTSTIDSNIHEIQDLYEEIESTQKEIIFTMGAIGESRSKETGNHVKRVASYSKILAELYGLDEVESELLKLASPMHDIGKVAISDEILKKPAKLTEAEFHTMKEHAALGYDMLKHQKHQR